MTPDNVALDIYDKIMKTWTADELRKFYSCSLRDLHLYEDTLGIEIKKHINIWEDCSISEYVKSVIEIIWENKFPKKN